jgi:anaerobic selenocysteine-containing dehydrogenase
MNRLGAALTGEVTDPPIMSLYVFGSNPAAIAPNAGLIVQGLCREDLFTVVHELFMTDTADYADIVLPATSQLEHADLHRAYGHTMLHYTHPAIPPLGESKSNWEVMDLLADALGFQEPWLHQSVDEVIAEILTATAIRNPALHGITLEQIKEGRPVSLKLESATPFADLRFPTPSGKVELFSQRLAESGHDPLPGWPDPAQVEWVESTEETGEHSSPPLTLISGAAHHFVTSSMANQPSLLAREGTPFIEIHPTDAAARNIAHNQTVIVENQRGWCQLRAVVTDTVRPGVAVSPKGRWSKLDGGRNVNWTTPDALADFAGQSTFHSNQVWVRRLEE